MKPASRKPVALAVLALLFACCTSVQARANEGSEWTPEVKDIAARLPVQDSGRIKPLSTLATFALLAIHHRRSCVDTDGVQRDALEWMLAALLRPAEVAEYPLFLLESHEVAEAIGVSTDGKEKRDRYAYRELSGGRERLMGFARAYAPIDAKERSPIQAQLVNLATSVLELERLAHFLDFARAEVDVTGIPAFQSLATGAPARLRFSQLLTAASESAPAQSPALTQLYQEVSALAMRGHGLRMFPPASTAAERAEWMSPAEVAEDALFHGRLDQRHLEMLEALEALVAADGGSTSIEEPLQAFALASRELADRRGEAETIDMEVAFYRFAPFRRGLVLYVLGFLTMTATWLSPRLKRVYGLSLGLVAGGAALHVAGIVMRCVLRGRPPVSTLYETILFVGAVAVLAALFLEWTDRRRIAAALAPVLGAIGLFLAGRFEEVQASDTMPQLVAVLDTNFWLATHVTCITIGYSSGLLAATFAHLYVLGRVLGVRRNDAGSYRSLARMIYGTLCFALVFSVVGTILGGVWANESWGRFWGWDPKENGALMIVLAQLAILHARLGGHLRAFGIAMASILQGCIVAFSWWGVNLLGVGLHSYGFTDGIWRALIVFYGIEAPVLLAGSIWWARTQSRLAPARRANAAPAASPPLPERVTIR